MGSFLISCCVTNQTIQEQEGVYILPIFENKTTKNVIHNTDLYGLLGFLFIGKYNDYGNYEIDWNNVSNQFMLKGYVDFLKNRTLSEYNLMNLKFENNNYEEVWNVIHQNIIENKLFIKQSNIDTTKVSYFVAHKKYLDILLDLYDKKDKESLFYSLNKERKIFSSLNKKEKALLMFNKYKDSILINEKGSSNNNESSSRIKEEILENIKNIHNAMETHYEFKHFLTNMDSSSSGFTVLYPYEVDFNQKLVLNYLNSYDDYLNIYLTLSKIKDILCSLKNCNIIIRPVYYAGQDYGNSIGLRFSYLMNKIHQQNISILKNEMDLDNNEELNKYIDNEVLQFDI